MTPRRNSGDYVPLDRATMPNATTPGSAARDRNGVETHGVSIVQMQESAWRERAAAASAAAEELKRCSQIVGQILLTNYFGRDCVEGTAVYDALKSTLISGPSNWSAKLDHQATMLEQLAETSLAAASRLSSADSLNSSQLRT